MTTIKNGEAFKLSDNCDGVIWQDDEGWHGCLRWDIKGNANFVGPYTTRGDAIFAIKTEFALSSGDRPTIH